MYLSQCFCGLWRRHHCNRRLRLLLILVCLSIFLIINSSYSIQTVHTTDEFHHPRYQLKTSPPTTAYVTPPPKMVARIDNEDRKPYLFVGNFGRLGNHMFEYASIFGIAAMSNRTAVLYPTGYNSLKTYFKGITAPVIKIPGGFQIQQIGEKGAGKFEKHFFYLHDADLELCCYLQSWRYFSEQTNELRQQFTFHEERIQDANTVITKLIHKHTKFDLNANIPMYKTSDITLVGVHVRRMDYTLEDEIKRGYKAAPLSYFHKAMDYYRQLYDNILFIICGDDLPWARENLSRQSTGTLARDVQFIDYPTNVDFTMLALCNHTIISVGTFGWWAAWLSPGTVVYYSNSTVPNTEIGNQYSKKDFFPPHWIGIAD